MMMSILNRDLLALVQPAAVKQRLRELCLAPQVGHESRLQQRCAGLPFDQELLRFEIDTGFGIRRC